MNKAGARSLNLYSKALRIKDSREQRLLSRRPWGKGGGGWKKYRKELINSIINKESVKHASLS